MAEAIGVASSITALIDVSVSVIKYLKDLKEAPKERDDLLNELSGLVGWLKRVLPLTTPPTVRPSLSDAAIPDDP